MRKLPRPTLADRMIKVLKEESPRGTHWKAWPTLKELFGDGLVIAFGGWFLFVFICIELYGRMVQLEQIDWIRRTEMAVCILIIALGLERLIKDISKGR